ncbi:MAG: ribonuclease E/G [Clostridiales bacterium]|nr:ribonuclease E/G [Clostridiales bacterium]
MVNGKMNDNKQSNNKLIITQKNNAIYYGYFVDGIPVELYCEPKQQQSLVGNIYAARVEKVADGIGGAFLEIGDGQKCYYPFTKGQQPLKLSPGHEDRLYGGDIILVQITKDAVKTKLPAADGNVSLDGKYFVLSIADMRVSLSRKITKSAERVRLQNLIEQYIGEYYCKEKSLREERL